MKALASQWEDEKRPRATRGKDPVSAGCWCGPAPRSEPGARGLGIAGQHTQGGASFPRSPLGSPAVTGDKHVPPRQI